MPRAALTFGGFFARSVLADPGETKNLAKSMPAVAASMKKTLDTFLPYVPALTPGNLACYNCSFDPAVLWKNFTGPGCIAKTKTFATAEASVRN